MTLSLWLQVLVSDIHDMILHAHIIVKVKCLVFLLKSKSRIQYLFSLADILQKLSKVVRSRIIIIKDIYIFKSAITNMSRGTLCDKDSTVPSTSSEDAIWRNEIPLYVTVVVLANKTEHVWKSVRKESWNCDWVNSVSGFTFSADHAQMGPAV